mmetsp:Transcript_29819/g.41216  ORF Transcript_29819/g.41216 Transcript_29819/m.41216 type:complete len:103 (-) Transcript_29819:11-319(-)
MELEDKTENSSAYWRGKGPSLYCATTNQLSKCQARKQYVIVRRGGARRNPSSIVPLLDTKPFVTQQSSFPNPQPNLHVKSIHRAWQMLEFVNIFIELSHFFI